MDHGWMDGWMDGCFLTEDIELYCVKTFNGESDSSAGITDSCSGCGRPHNAHPTAKINKVKDLALICLSVSLPHHNFIFIFCQKSILSKRFSTHFLTTLLLMSGLHRCWQRIF